MLNECEASRSVSCKVPARDPSHCSGWQIADIFTCESWATLLVSWQHLYTLKSHLRFLKKEGYFGIFCKAKLFAVRERQRCSSWTTTLLFANSNVADAHRQMKMTSRNRGTAIRSCKIGCMTFSFVQLRSRIYLLYRLHGILYAVSAINRKSFIVLWYIDGHWQMKTGIYNLRNSVLPPSETTIFYCLFTFLSDTNCHKLPKNSRSSLNTTHYTLNTTL